MKRGLFLMLFLLLVMDYNAYSNPLFAPLADRVEIRSGGTYYYCNGNLFYREVGNASGTIYDVVDGEAFEIGYYVEDGDPRSNVYRNYYDLDGNYCGKCLISTSSEAFSGDQIITLSYIDHKNRPVATYVERGTVGSLLGYSAAEQTGDVNAGIDAILGLLGAAFNNNGVSVGRTFLLSGKIRTYNN